MNIHFIKSSEKKRIVQELNLQFGIQKLPYLLIKSGKEKIRAFSGHLSKEEIKSISYITNIELIGVYLIKKEESLRLTLDATHLLKDQIIKSTVEITDEQLNDWIRGYNLEIQTSRGIKVIRHGSDFVGCGKSNTQKIFNYIPKDRRLKMSRAYR